RTRMLVTLELAITLPALGLIGYSVWHLRSIQRDRVVEAAIQRDFFHMLKIAEKRMNSHAYKAMDELRSQFPRPDEAVAPKLERIVEKHPEVAHVMLYDRETGFLARSQTRRMGDPYFRTECEHLSGFNAWMKIEGQEILQKLQQLERKDGMPYSFQGDVEHRGDRVAYQNYALMTLPGWPQDRVALGFVVFDSEYLREHFFPEILDNLLAEDLGGDPHGGRNGSNPAVMMLHIKKESEPLAASAGWDGGKPEVDRNLEGAFPGLTLAIKFRGTTVEALGQKFLVTSALIIGGLSLLLAGGVWLTYRNVAKEMALAKLKSDFVANVSHELRTPLSLIRLYAETLEMGRLTSPEKYQEYFRIIRKESERLSALINNILDFSRIEAGRKEYSFRETNLAELVRSTLESYRFQIEQNGFTLGGNIADDLPLVNVDREAIARSLLNLINNALKYSGNEKYLAVNLYGTDGTAKLEVIDRGIGIPRGEQPKIFEKFYRVGDPLVHNTKGSGLGLALVRHIVQAHGGQIWVESTPGQGSKFTIALPLESGSGAASAA
ncbi:MAG TPA: HAMP domain-containing sensor histidine kinase, partial [Candidatus Acidoferrales bacterium]|nr:HAMP domain-containing sensor histidine kinase [Candidatus Acidoferrales bacterium]